MIAAFRRLAARVATPDAFAVTQGVLDALDTDARRRCDTRAIARIQEARAIITHECLRASQARAA